MDLLLVLLVFGVTFIAELPDKSMFAAMVLSTKLPARYVFLGAAVAFAVHVVIAVTAGSLLALLPQTLLNLIIAVVFGVGAMVLARASRHEPQSEAPQESVAERGARGPWAAMGASFGVMFLGEWGDITQLMTANLAAKYDSPVLVGIGAVLGLWAAAAIGILAGRTLLAKVPNSLLHRIGAALFAAFAVFSLVDALT